MCLKNFCSLLNDKVRCNHLHKLMKIILTTSKIPSYFVQARQTSNTTPPKRRQWFLRLKNATLKKCMMYAMMDHPCKVCVHIVCLPVNSMEDNCWSTFINDFKLFIICL